MSEQFKWDDQTAKEFIEFMREKAYSSALTDFEKDLKAFKESKQPKPEWEILSIMCGSLWYDKSENVFINGGHHVTIEWALDNDFSIHAVRRLSDSEIFTIGDKFTGNAGCDLTIKSFEIVGKYINVWSVEYGYWPLKSIKKRVPLFKTEDGVNIYEGMKYYFIDNWNIRYTGDNYNWVGGGLKAFSTKDKATNWIIENKPCLSYNDIKDFLYRNEVNHVEQIIKDKLKLADSQ